MRFPSTDLQCALSCYMQRMWTDLMFELMIKFVPIMWHVMTFVTPCCLELPFCAFYYSNLHGDSFTSSGGFLHVFFSVSGFEKILRIAVECYWQSADRLMMSTCCQNQLVDCSSGATRRSVTAMTLTTGALRTPFSKKRLTSAGIPWHPCKHCWKGVGNSRGLPNLEIGVAWHWRRLITGLGHNFSVISQILSKDKRKKSWLKGELVNWTKVLLFLMQTYAKWQWDWDMYVGLGISYIQYMYTKKLIFFENRLEIIRTTRWNQNSNLKEDMFSPCKNSYFDSDKNIPICERGTIWWPISLNIDPEKFW